MIRYASTFQPFIGNEVKIHLQTNLKYKYADIESIRQTKDQNINQSTKRSTPFVGTMGERQF